MLNGLGEIQNIMVIGGKSDIALSTIRSIPRSRSGKIFLLGKSIQREIPQIEDSEVVCIEYDITNPAKRIESIRKIFNRVDIDLVILAVGFLGPQPNISDATSNKLILDINFCHSAEVLRYVISQFKEQNHGKLLVFSSIASLRPRLNNYIYGSAKSGLDFIARGTQLDLVQSNISLCIARLGFVHTKMTSGLRPAPFAISAEKAGKICAKGILKSKKIFYVPGILRYLAFVIQVIPSCIIKRFS